MSNKIIGIPGFKTDNSFGVPLTYMEFASRYGDVRIIMPHEEFVKVDLLLIPGGMDLNPTSYGQSPSYRAGHIDVHKQYFYDNRLRNYIGKNTPIFGICLGFQQLLSFFRCPITQHFNFHPQSKDRWQDAHDVTINDGRSLKVNSHHHQGVLLKNLNTESIEAIATYEDLKEGIIVEAFRHKERSIAGVQWHPKFFGAC